MRYAHDHVCPEGAGASAPDAEPEPAPFEAPHIPGYEIAGELGRGGEAVVFAGRAADGEQVAIKVVRATAGAARLRREAKLLSRVGTPAAPRVLDRGTADGAAYLVIGLLQPPTLADQMAAALGPVSEAEAAPLIRAVVGAVAQVHERGVVHCDLKPENVFLSGTGETVAAHLIDFGIARTVDGKLAPDEALAGTAEYMAPEQCEPGTAIGPAVDVYALGVVIYELLAGRPPFFGPGELVRQAHTSRRPPLPSRFAAVGSAMEDVLVRCLRKDPAERFASIAALAVAVDVALAADVAHEQRYTPTSTAAIVPTRRAVPTGLLFFESTRPALEIRHIIESFAGDLAHVAGTRFVIAFGQQVSENPVRRAVQAATGLIGHALCTRALIDLAPVRVRERRSSRRYISPLFARDDRYPTAAHPLGVMLTADAVGVVSDLVVTQLPEVEPALFHLDEAAGNEPETVIAQAGAPMTGRDAEHSALIESARHAISARVPTIATVTADVGIGKTRLAVELFQPLRAFAAVHLVRVGEPIGGAERATQREFVRQLLALPDRAPDDGGRALFAARLGELAADIWPALAVAVGWLAPDAAPLRQLAVAPGALRAFAVRALGLAIVELAGRGPLCVIVDDAHFADDITLDALEFATLAEREVPLWVCALVRTDFAAARPAWGERAGRAQPLELGELDPEHATVLCRYLLRPAADVPAKTVEAICERTGGTPLLLVELIRRLHREGVIRQRPRGDGYFVATDELGEHTELPLIQWLVEREIAQLPPDLAAHAGLAACFSGVFFASDVAGVLAELERAGQASSFPLDAKAGLRLLDGNLLISDRDDGFTFRHALMREVLAARLPDAVRASVHEAAYHYFSERADERARIAYHAEYSGLTAEAARLYVELAEAARRRHAYLQAEELYTRALALIDDQVGTARMHAMRGRGIMRYRSGRYGDAIADLSRAGELAAQLGDTETQIDALLDEAMALDWMQEYRRGAERVDQAGALMGAGAPPRLEAALLLGRGRSELHRTNPELGCQLLEECAQLAEGLGVEGYEVLVAALLMLGTVHANAGRTDPAQRAFAHAMTLAEEYRDQFHVAAVCINRRMLNILLGDREGVVRDIRRSLQIGRELGMSGIEYVNQYNLGEFLYQLGDLDACLAHVERAIEIEERVFGGAVRPVAALLASRVHVFAGQPDAARARLADIERRQAAARDAGNSETDFQPNEQILHETVRLAVAEPDDDAWNALVERARACTWEQELIEVIELRGLAALRRGKMEIARDAFDAALEVAQTIPNVLGDRVRRHLDALGAG